MAGVLLRKCYTACVKPFFLIADDSDAKAAMLEGMVRHAWGKRVEILRAHTTEEALALITKRPQIAFAFVDYEIPTAEGPAVIAALQHANPSARIACVSASNLERYQKNAAETGAEAYICTSLDSDTVEQSISSLLMEWDPHGDHCHRVQHREMPA